MSLSDEELAAIDSVMAESIGVVAAPPAAKAGMLHVIAEIARLRLPVRGVSVKVVSRNKARRTVSVLIGFAPGATLAGHHHQSPEETYVVSGSCRIGDHSLSKGDFHHIDAGARHGDVVSDAGCVLLVTTGTHDYRAAWIASVARLLRWSQSP